MVTEIDQMRHLLYIDFFLGFQLYLSVLTKAHKNSVCVLHQILSSQLIASSPLKNNLLFVTSACWAAINNSMIAIIVQARVILCTPG